MQVLRFQEGGSPDAPSVAAVCVIPKTAAASAWFERMHENVVRQLGNATHEARQLGSANSSLSVDVSTMDYVYNPPPPPPGGSWFNCADYYDCGDSSMWPPNDPGTGTSDPNAPNPLDVLPAERPDFLPPDLWEKLVNAWGNMSTQERAMAMNPEWTLTLPGYFAGGELANRISFAKYGYDDDGTRQNAYKHAYWNCYMASHMTEAQAAAWGTAHENKPNEWISNTNMDLQNNFAGRYARSLYSPVGEYCEDAIDQAAANGFLYYYKDDGSGVPLHWPPPLRPSWQQWR